MKEYITPEIEITELEPEPILSSSDLSIGGNVSGGEEIDGD